ncbi:MAG TPA: hypothetical protein VNT26_01835, partial [Candidatus Sulfotelmatobacter sp.]|nr:hypothetical protein [Candidatus Sulfotelmatobacter sp.]
MKRLSSILSFVLAFTLHSQAGDLKREPLARGNKFISVSFEPLSGKLSVLDKRTQQTWSQDQLAADIEVQAATPSEKGLELKLHQKTSNLDFVAAFDLEPKAPELTCTLSAKGTLPGKLLYPPPFLTGAGTYLVVPLAEGIRYPVDDASIPNRSFSVYAAWGLSMAFWGVTDGQQGHAAIFETPWDAAIDMKRVDGKL